MAGISVIVTDDGPAARKVQTTLVDWAIAGLIDECLWVTLDDIDRAATPPRVRATLIGAAGSLTDDLFRVIGMRRLATVRLVVAQLMIPGEEPSPDLPAAARELQELLLSALPRQTKDGVGGARLRCANVLLPVSGAVGLPQSALIPGWDVNAVVAAEDRPDLDRASIFVRDGVNYTGHAAAGIASVAALWPGIDVGCLDSLEADSTTTESDVAVVRSAVRAIIRDNAADGLADSACAHILGNSGEPAHVVEWARPALEPDGIIDAAVAEIQSSGDWVARTPDRTPSPRRGVVGFWSAFKTAAVFNARLYGLALKAGVGMGKRAVENAATSAIVGSEGDHVIRLRATSGRSIVRRAKQRMEEQSGDLRASMLADEAGSVAAPSAGTWASLRRWCFGLVDGSALPGEYVVPDIAGKPQLLPPLAVVPDPHDTYRTASGAVVRACDVPAAEVYLAELREAAAIPAPEPDDDAAVSGQAPVEPAEADEEDLSEAVRAARAELAAFEGWLRSRRGTLAWRVYEGVHSLEAQKAAEAKRAHGDATATLQPPSAELMAAQRNLILAWTLVTVMAGGGIFYLWWVPYQAEILTAEEFWKAVGGVLGVVLLLGTFFNHQYYKAVRHFEWMVEQTLAHRRRTAERYVVAYRESRRLRLLASRFNEWTDIIGTVLHRPWQAAPGRPRTLPVEKLEAMPAAVAVAVAFEQEASIRPVVMARAIQVLRPRGWANAAFDRAIASYEATVRSAREGGHLAADLDTLHSATSPLGLLWAFFVEGDAGRHETVDARRRIGDALRDGVLELPPRSVRRVGPFADGAEVSDVEFLSRVDGPAVPFVTDIWSPEGMLRQRFVPDKSVAWVPGTPVKGARDGLERHTAGGDISVRVDLSRRCDAADLRLFVDSDDGGAEAPERSVRDLGLVGDFN